MKIKTWKKAWETLGNFFEQIEFDGTPRYKAFQSGICMALNVAVGKPDYFRGIDSRLSTFLKDNIEQSILRKMQNHMDSTIRLQYALSSIDPNFHNRWDCDMLGGYGTDYGVRAEWCYLQAKVGPLPEFRNKESQIRTLKKIMGVPY